MQAQTTNTYEIIERLPAGSALTLRNVSWQEYEELLAEVGDAHGLRLSYDEGTLKIMTLSSKHESYIKFIERLVDRLSIYLGFDILFFGSSTMKQKQTKKGAEPDACFYIQSAHLLGNKIQIDFTSDPPPDVVVEVDIHHESLSKLPIYAALGVSEIWIYDEQALKIYYLQNEQYIEAESSAALPLLTSRRLTDLLSRLQHAAQYEILRDFEIWLQTQQP